MRRFNDPMLLVVSLAMVGLGADLAQACPGCKQALESAGGHQATMVNGYFWSILFMMSMPFTLLGVFGGSMYLAVRRARRANEHSQPAMNAHATAGTEENGAASQAEVMAGSSTS